MIFIGECDKQAIISDYISKNEISKIFVIGSDLPFKVDNAEHIKFSDVIMYKFFYRLLQEVSTSTLIILNECLRKTNRYDLSYNCIRRYALQTQHRLIFNYFPIIKNKEDFMILWDLNQQNPFLKESYKYSLQFYGVFVGSISTELTINKIPIDDKVIFMYECEKEKIINSINKDPDIVPRRLLKFSEKYKNSKIPGLDSLSKIKPIMNVGVTDLKVDKYYLSLIYKFKEEMNDVVEKIQCK